MYNEKIIRFFFFKNMYFFYIYINPRQFNNLKFTDKTTMLFATTQFKSWWMESFIRLSKIVMHLKQNQG